MRYLDMVKARHCEQQHSRSKKAEDWSNRLTPLEARLAKVLGDIPPEVVEKGLSLESLRRLLAGKWRGNCHPGELGKALRSQKFVRRRAWTDSANGFRALWFKENEK